MPLHSFSFPLPETRLFEADGLVYKFQIRGGSSSSRVEFESEDSFNQELEGIVRTVLGNLSSLAPFSSTHYTVFPYRKRWRASAHRGGRRPTVYPYVLILYLEDNMERRTQVKRGVMQQVPSEPEPQPKRCRTDSPLEEAIIKDLLGDMEAEHTVSPNRKVDGQQAGAEVREDAALSKEKMQKGADKAAGKPGVSAFGESVSPGEEEEEEDEEEEEEEEEAAAPVRRGILTRVARHIFPFSLLFRET